ncbi:MAG: hypothetical protein U0931_03130 [Vulcanimicrobiota bacterium]
MFRKMSCLFLLGMGALLMPGCGSDSVVDIGNFSNLVQIVFATQPQNINLGSTLPELRIEGRDQFGQIINVSQGQVELRLGNNPSGASLLVNGVSTASTTVTVSNGMASFNGIGVDRSGTGYTLVATFTAPNTTGSLSATSQPFNVSGGQVASVIFMRSTASLWGSAGDSDATTLDSAFGTGNWTLANFETAVPAEVFQGTNRLVFMDGGDQGANAFANFLTANNAIITTFVQNGGRVILNAAPNVGGSITTPFNATIAYDMGTSRTTVRVDPNHPIGTACNGTLQFTGGSFSHALVVADDMTPIITSNPPPVNARALTLMDNVVLAEGRVGSGLVLVGGMTTPNFHGPVPNSNTLRVNILRYAGGLPLITAGPPTT